MGRVMSFVIRVGAAVSEDNQMLLLSLHCMYGMKETGFMEDIVNKEGAAINFIFVLYSAA